MIRNYLKTTLRYFLKNKKHVLINLFGIGIATACCIIAFINFQFSDNFDGQHSRLKEIYRLNMKYFNNGEEMKVGIVPLPLYDLTKENVNNIENITRLGEERMLMRAEGELFPVRVGFADPAFFEMFEFEFLYGNPESINDLSALIITESVAIRYFGRVDVVGESFTGHANDDKLDFKIGGVIKDLPLNGSFGFEAITNIQAFFNYKDVDPTHSWEFPYLMLAHIPNPGKVSQVFTEIDHYLDEGLRLNDYELNMDVYPEPMYGMQARPRFRSYWLRRGMPDKAVSVPLLLSIAVLLIACINFTNTTVSIASQRLKEIGIRKVMGGLQSQLIFQFLTESIVICLLSLGLGLILAEIFLPIYSNMWPWLDLKIVYSENLPFFGFLIGLLAVTALLAGGYPAFYISKFKPTSILKGQTVLIGANWFTKSLLLFQFVVSVLMIVNTVGFWSNSRYQTKKDLGFYSEGIFYQYFSNGEEVQFFKQELEKYPQVKGVTGSYNNIYNMDTYWKFEVEGFEIRSDIIRTSADYVDFMEMEIIKGRNFQENSETDRQQSVLINESFADKLGGEDVVGKEMIFEDSLKYYVVGVFKDIYSSSFFRPIRPLALMYADDTLNRQLIVKVDINNLEQVEAHMESLFRETFPNRLFNPQYLDEEVKRATETNQNALGIFMFLGIVSLLLTGTGLYSLISMNIAKKTKEIGIRKVLGADVGNIVKHLNMQFIVLLIIALVVGLPLGKIIVNYLISTLFFYHQPVSFSTLFISLFIMVALAIISVAGQVNRAIRENPINSLRSE